VIASAIKELSLSKAFRRTELPGRVKYTRDHLSHFDCSPGGGLLDRIVKLDVRLKGILGTYKTRCTFDLRMPPLKIASASPMLQTACPGIG
jgi:hypothetical protein